MSWKKELFENFKLYAVTDLRDENESILTQIEAVYRGGADIVQLRSKTVPDAALLRLGQKIRAIADRMQKLFFVNDRPDLALAVKADGVHLGQDDLPVNIVRKMAAQAGSPFFIGKSTHSIEQARAAVAEGPDYIGAGPVFETPTKPGYRPAGLEYIGRVSREIHIPFVAIGGINAVNARQVLEAGARRLAVVRAVFEGENNEQRTRELRSQIEAYERCPA